RPLVGRYVHDAEAYPRAPQVLGPGPDRAARRPDAGAAGDARGDGDLPLAAGLCAPAAVPGADPGAVRQGRQPPRGDPGGRHAGRASDAAPARLSRIRIRTHKQVSSRPGLGPGERSVCPQTPRVWLGMTAWNIECESV